MICIPLFPRCFFFGLCALLSVATAFAQEPQFREQDRRNQPVAPAGDGLTTLPPGAEELGIQRLLRRVKRPPWLTASSDTQVFYVSDVLLNTPTRQHDTVTTQALTLSVSPPWLEKPKITLSLSEEFYRYDIVRRLDFNATNVDLSASYPLNDRLTVQGGYSGLWLRSRSGGNEFYHDHSASLGVTGFHPLHSRVLLFGGARFDYHRSHPNTFSRNDIIGYLGTRVAITKKISAEGFYRFGFEDFSHSSRSDLSNMLGASATWRISEFATLRLMTSHVWNDSNQAARDYSVFNGGGAFTLSFKF